MKLVPLTKGFSAIVDDIDYAAVIAIGTWCYFGGYACHYYSDDQGRRQRLFMHRFIMSRMLGHNIPEGLQVDHINGPELGKDARRENFRDNLRLATKSENQAAKGIQVNSTTGTKGVNLRFGKWSVRLRYYHKRLSFGCYDTFYEAQTVFGYVHRLLWKSFSTEHSVPDPSDDLQAYVIRRLLEQGVKVDLTAASD